MNQKLMKPRIINYEEYVKYDTNENYAKICIQYIIISKNIKQKHIFIEKY